MFGLQIRNWGVSYWGCVLCYLRRGGVCLGYLGGSFFFESGQEGFLWGLGFAERLHGGVGVLLGAADGGFVKLEKGLEHTVEGEAAPLVGGVGFEVIRYAREGRKGEGVAATVFAGGDALGEEELAPVGDFLAEVFAGLAAELAGADVKEMEIVIPVFGSKAAGDDEEGEGGGVGVHGGCWFKVKGSKLKVKSLRLERQVHHRGSEKHRGEKKRENEE